MQNMIPLSEVEATAFEQENQKGNRNTVESPCLGFAGTHDLIT